MKTYHLTNPLMKGTDLEPLQKSLKNQHLYGGPIDGVFGNSTAQACKKAKYRLGYPNKAIIPTGGQQLLNFLHGTKGLPTTYAIRRHTRGFGLTRAQRQREAIVKYAMWGIHNAASLHYAQVRPMDQLHHVEHLPWWTDCSEFVTTIYKWANSVDPNGMGFNGYGNTDTMYNHGEFISLWDAKPADVIIWKNWGGYGTHHTAVITDVDNKLDPMLASMGSENGPYHISLSRENRAQAGRAYVVKRYIKD